MKHIQTTATAVKKLKARAKIIQKERELAYQQALEASAQEAGYASWFHVQWCCNQGQKDIPPAVVDERKADELEEFRRRLIDKPQRYLDYLEEKSKGARIERFPPKGDIFHAIEVDGRYFYGSISGSGPVIVRRNSRLKDYDVGWVQLGVASIHFTSNNQRNDEGNKTWSICKYGPSEARVPLDGLSLAACHAVAYEFGVPVHYPFGYSREFLTDDIRRWIGGDFKLFYFSPAFHSLCEIAQLHPRKARGWMGNSYLGDWGEQARAGVRG